MNKLENDKLSFKLEDLRLPVPDEIFQQIVSYLDPKSVQSAIQVNHYFAANTLTKIRTKENSLSEVFAKFLCENLNRNLYQEQINQITPFCNSKKILLNSNLIEIKSSLSELKKDFLSILISLNIEDLNELKKLHLSRSKPAFFEDIFDIAIADVSKIYQQLDEALAITDQDEREDDLQKVCLSFIKVNNINKAIELTNEIGDIDKKGLIFTYIFHVFIKKEKVDECFDIFNKIKSNQFLRAGLFSALCKFLAENKYFDELYNFIDKIEDLEKELETQEFLEFKNSVISDVYEILIPLPENKDYTPAINLAYSLKDPSMKMYAFCLICRDLIEKNELNQALTILDAFTLNLLPNLPTKAEYWLLLAICESLIESENIDKALEILDARIGDEVTKAYCFCTASVLLAEKENYAKALEIAQRINVPEIRNIALEEINLLFLPL